MWLIIAVVLGFGFWVTRVLGPKAAPKDGDVVTGKQKGYFALAVALLWAASDWPVHDISEEYLYWVHMVQHLSLIHI